MSVDKMQEIANVIGDTNADVHIIGANPVLLNRHMRTKTLAIIKLITTNTRSYPLHCSSLMSFSNSRFIECITILSKLPSSKIMIVTALQNARAVKVAKLYQNIATSYDPNARIEVNNDKWLERCKELRGLSTDID
jgi:hypothetical protein